MLELDLLMFAERQKLWQIKSRFPGIFWNVVGAIFLIEFVLVVGR
jgi:hypothetical protein